MKIRLSNGKTIGVSGTDVNNREASIWDDEDNIVGGRHGQQDGAPSKRQVKHLGGSMKRHNSRTRGAGRGASSVGGYTDTVRAIYAPADTPMCVVRSETKSDERLRGWERELLGIRVAEKKYTWEVGGSCSTGYIGGRG